MVSRCTLLFLFTSTCVSAPFIAPKNRVLEPHAAGFDEIGNEAVRLTWGLSDESPMARRCAVITESMRHMMHNARLTSAKAQL